MSTSSLVVSLRVELATSEHEWGTSLLSVRPPMASSPHWVLSVDESLWCRLVISVLAWLEFAAGELTWV